MAYAALPATPAGEPGKRTQDKKEAWCAVRPRGRWVEAQPAAPHGAPCRSPRSQTRAARRRKTPPAKRTLQCVYFTAPTAPGAVSFRIARTREREGFARSSSPTTRVNSAVCRQAAMAPRYAVARQRRRRAMRARQRSRRQNGATSTATKCMRPPAGCSTATPAQTPLRDYTMSRNIIAALYASASSHPARRTGHQARWGALSPWLRLRCLMRKQTPR